MGLKYVEKITVLKAVVLFLGLSVYWHVKRQTVNFVRF